MTLPATVRAVLLDLDDTLIDGSAIFSTSIAVSTRVAEEHPEFGVDTMSVAKANGANWQKSWAAHEEPWILGEIDDVELSSRVWAGTFADLGVADDPALVRETAALHVRLLDENSVPFDEVPEVLRRLRDAGLTLAIVTNGTSSAQRAKIATLGADLFAAVAISAEVGVAKPDPGIFERVLAELGLSADQVVHVGDSAYADIGGASAAGIATVWVGRGDAEYPAEHPAPDAHISSLAELPALLGL